MALIRRNSEARKTLGMSFSRESAGKSSTGRPPAHNRPLPQPTIFEQMDVDSLTSSKGSDFKLPLKSTRVRNIVVFGDSGVGKSSLINMLAGRKTAVTSSGVLGCTFQARQYRITIGEEEVNIWDTAGLDEGTRGRVPSEVAEKNLVKLLRELRGADGIHLLVYCIRGPSIRKSLARNYVIFYSAICRKKVPIVAVVTGLENEPASMEGWWIEGEKELARYKMRFDAHACVTTIEREKLAGSVFEERSKSSQEVVRKLIIDNCHRTAIRPPSDPNVFIKAALHDFQGMMKSGWENIGPTSAVVFCQTDIQLFHAGVFGDLSLRIHSQIRGRSFVFHHVYDISGRCINQKLSKGGADLLIFAGKMSNANLQEFQKFYTSYSGEVCPLLVVTDNHSVDAWTRHLSDEGIGARVESFSRDGRTPADLSGSIDELCLIRGATGHGKGNILRYLRRKPRENAVDMSALH